MNAQPLLREFVRASARDKLARKVDLGQPTVLHRRCNYPVVRIHKRIRWGQCHRYPHMFESYATSQSASSGNTV